MDFEKFEKRMKEIVSFYNMKLNKAEGDDDKLLEFYGELGRTIEIVSCFGYSIVKHEGKLKLMKEVQE